MKMNITAARLIIKENCIRTHGSFEAALDIALNEARARAIESHEHWKERGANIHVVVEIERID